VGVPLNDFVAVPFERRVATSENQFTLDSVIRDIPASELPPVFPTPVEVTPGGGALRLTAMPPVQAPEALRNEAAFAAEYLRPYFGSTRKAGVLPLRLEVGPVVVLSYGFGLALWWRIGAGAAMAIAAAIIVVQIPLSAWWLSRFRFGPIEWIWRRLTYGRPLALRA
jgi:hypothetical protein